MTKFTTWITHFREYPSSAASLPTIGEWLGLVLVFILKMGVFSQIAELTGFHYVGQESILDNIPNIPLVEHVELSGHIRGHEKLPSHLPPTIKFLKNDLPLIDTLFKNLLQALHRVNATKESAQAEPLMNFVRSYDTDDCGRRMMCLLGATDQPNHQRVAKNIRTFFNSFAQEPIGGPYRVALLLGLTTKNTRHCAVIYARCDIKVDLIANILAAAPSLSLQRDVIK